MNLEIRKKLISELGNCAFMSDEESDALLKKYVKLPGIPPVVGILGTPGAGKSTFIGKLLDAIPDSTQVGLILLDPGNPTHTGSLLGDRVRLSKHYLRENIFIRSITFGKNRIHHLAEVMLAIFSQYPFDLLLIEDVGGGQLSSEMLNWCFESILVFDPTAGDEVQRMKSGVLDMVSYIYLSKTDLIDPRGIIEDVSAGRKENIHVFYEQNSIAANFSNIIQLAKQNTQLNKMKLLKHYLKKRISMQFLDFIGEFINDEKIQTELLKVDVNCLLKKMLKNF